MLAEVVYHITKTLEGIKLAAGSWLKMKLNDTGGRKFEIV